MNTTTETLPGSRPFQRVSLASHEPRPALMYAYKGVPAPKNGWKVSASRMAELDAAGLLLFPERPNGTIHLKRDAAVEDA